MVLKKLEFPPESGNVDTYDFTRHLMAIHSLMRINEKANLPVGAKEEDF